MVVRMLVSVQCFLLDAILVPAGPMQRTMSAQFVDRFVLLPMRQSTAGRLAWRQFLVSSSYCLAAGALTALGSTDADWESWNSSRSLLLDALPFAAIGWTGCYVLQLMAELAIPGQTHLSCVQRFFSGQQRQNNPLVDWFTNTLRYVPLTQKNRRHFVLNFLIHSQEEGFDPLSNQDAARVHSALKAAVESGPQTDTRSGAVELSCLRDAVGSASLTQSYRQVLLLVLSLAAALVGTAFFLI